MKLRILALGLAGAVSTITLTACGGGGGAADPMPTAAATKTASEALGRVADDNDVPIASRTAVYAGDSVRIDVLSLRRDGELSTLRFSVTNLGSDEYSIDYDLGSGPADYDVSGISLVDGENSKRYLAAHDSKDGCVCSKTSGVRIKPRTSYQLTSTFAAPPADVTTVQLDIPGVGTLRNVPVN